MDDRRLDAAQFVPTPAAFVFDGIPGLSFFDTAIDVNAFLYFGLKAKHGWSVAGREAFLERLDAALRHRIDLTGATLIYPQSGHGFLRAVAERLGAPAVELKKATKASILAALAATPGIPKAQRLSVIGRCAAMEGEIRAHQLRLNQRELLVPHLLDSSGVVLPDGPLLLLDDSLFSGATLRAAVCALARLGRRPDQIVAVFRCGETALRAAASTD